VAPAAAYEARRALFDMLSRGLAVAFEPHTPGAYSALQGLIALSEDRKTSDGATAHGLSVYQVYSSDPIASSAQSAITFTSSELVHRAFRSKTLLDSSVAAFASVPELSECLARVANQPVWTVERTAGGQRHCVGIDLPPFAGDEFFHAHFRSSRWFAMTPLLHFLWHLLGPEGWILPEPRATFIIDDPNLHYRRYGYIDFEKLAKHAEAHQYHVTLATVPLDAWYFDRGVAGLFRTHKARLSLMMHGVNHIADELARGYSDQDALQLLSDGLRRIAAFESRADLKVDRVMAAPHGAFAESIADPMVRLGFEAACVSVGSLVRWNSGKQWSADLGLPFVQAFGTEGFPVFHRTSTNELDVRLSAFLGHPIIIATHHQDCVSNFALFESLASAVNEIAAVRWMTIADISRTNYLSRFENGVLHVKPFARQLTIPIPQDAVTLQLEPSPFSQAAAIDLRKKAANDEEISGICRYDVLNDALHVFFPPKEPVDYKQVRPARLGLWPITRRVLAETRDRVKPMLNFASAR
jgi:hypothetical protein